MTTTEKRLLDLSDRFAATLNHAAREQIRAQYKAMHADWVRTIRR